MKLASLILAGGQAQRMGGVDKGLRKPLVQHVIERMEPQVSNLWLCANRHLMQYQKFGHRVFKDDEALQGSGPLAGIASFLQHLPHEFMHIQITPCDTPYLPINLCAHLKQHINNYSHPTSTGADPQTELGKQYGCALVVRNQLNSALQCLTQQQRSLQVWLTHAHAVPNFIDANFININTQTQLTNAQYSPFI